MGTLKEIIRDACWVLDTLVAGATVTRFSIGRLRSPAQEGCKEDGSQTVYVALKVAYE